MTGFLDFLIKNKLQSGRTLAGAVNLYAKDGSLPGSKMEAADVPGNTKKKAYAKLNLICSQ